MRASIAVDVLSLASATAVLAGDPPGSARHTSPSTCTRSIRVSPQTKITDDLQSG
jgi:hypothetical protein